MLRPIFMRNIPVRRMLHEELRLTVQRILHALLHVDILLTTVDDTDEAELEWIHATGKDVRSIRARIHQVQFGQDTDSSSPLWVD